MKNRAGQRRKEGKRKKRKTMLDGSQVNLSSDPWVHTQLCLVSNSQRTGQLLLSPESVGTCFNIFLQRGRKKSKQSGPELQISSFRHLPLQKRGKKAASVSFPQLPSRVTNSSHFLSSRLGRIIYLEQLSFRGHALQLKTLGLSPSAIGK